VNRGQLRQAASYLESDAEIDLRSHANRRPGGYDWPDDSDRGFLGSVRKSIYEEKLALAKGLRKLALSVPSATEQALRRRTARD